MRGLLALGLLVLFAAGVAGGGDAKTDSAKLQGKWVGEVNMLGKVELSFAKDTFTLTLGEDKRTFKGTFKIDPSKKPKEVDLTVTEAQGKIAKGIYELTGDTLKWCLNQPGHMDRAKEFKDLGPRYLNVTFQRVK